MRLTGIRIVVAGIVGLAILSGNLLIMLFPTPASSQRPPSVNEYAAHVGNARTIPAGGLVLDGIRLFCGRRPTVLDPSLDDNSAAYGGFLILNPKLIARVPTAVKI